jgi:hypothetical protein
MEIKKIIGKVMESTKFNEWKNSVKGYYLSYVYKMIGKENEEFQVGFVNKENDYIVTFAVKSLDDEVEFVSESEPFKKPEDEIKELNLDDLNIDWKKALDITQEVMKTDYSAHIPLNTFFILQNLDEGDVYNITYLTKSFSTINFKISAVNGELLTQSCNSIMDLAKWEKGERER